MKKLSILLAFLVFTTNVVFAQDFDFNRAYSDYLHNFNLYRTVHLEYVSAKSEYLTYKTLEAQTKALEKTRSMLEARNQVLIIYLTALRMRLAETTKVTDYEQNMRYIQLDNRIDLLKVNTENLSSPSTIEDLLAVSSEVEGKYPSIELLAYQTLETIVSDFLNDLRDRVGQQAEKTEEKVNQMRDAGEDTATLERWLIEVREKINLASQKRQEGKDILAKMQEQETNKKDRFLSAQKKFEESNQYLKEAVSYLKEIVKKIKYG